MPPEDDASTEGVYGDFRDVLAKLPRENRAIGRVWQDWPAVFGDRGVLFVGSIYLKRR